MTSVWTPGGSTFLPAGLFHSQTWRGPKKKASNPWAEEKVSGHARSSHQLRHYLPGSITQPKLHDYLGAPTIFTRTIPWSIQVSYTKTLRSLLLLRYLQLDSMIPSIHGSDYAVRFFSCSECCNAPISMWAVMNCDVNLCMVILQSSGTIWAVTRRS